MNTIPANPSVYHFPLGDAECLAVSDGVFPLPAANFFANAPEDELECALRRHGIDDGQVPTPFQCLVVRTAGHTILIDTGMGSARAPLTGRLPENLSQAGIAPEDVDIVLFSHGHADHTGGAVDAQERPAFPKARYLIGREEFAFWMSDEAVAKAGARGPAARRILKLLQPRLEMTRPGEEIVPGIAALPAPGHTPFNSAFSIRRGGQKLLYVADAIAHLIHLEHTDWHLEADLDPPEAMRTRANLLELAAREQCLIFAYHLPHPAVGRIGIGSAGNYEWTPLA